MDWYAEAEFVARVDVDQVEAIAPRYVAAYYNSVDRVLRLRQRLDADHDDYEAAIGHAHRWVRAEVAPTVQGLDPGAQVIRVVVESAEAVMRRLVGPKEAAELLGVSPARLRQLAGLPGFPAGLPTSAGSVWPRDVMEAYAVRRPRGGKGGRPRKEPAGP